jgi:Zn finger protein HypA/HybF involved in hydrogenase expression
MYNYLKERNEVVFMEFNCVNCKCKLSDDENTAFCPDCKVIILPFLKFLYKAKNEGNISAVNTYEVYRQNLNEKGVTESGSEHIYNYCKCLDENYQKNTIRSNKHVTGFSHINKKGAVIIGILIFIVVLSISGMCINFGGSAKGKSITGLCDNCGINKAAHNISSSELCDICYDDLLNRLINKDD